jgi:glycosyl transferase, family 25
MIATLSLGMAGGVVMDRIVAAGPRLDCRALPSVPVGGGVKVNTLVDAVFVLSVRSFTDRIAHIRAELARHAIDFEFVFDFDANAIPAQLLERRFAPSDLQRTHQSLVLKHVRTWELACERGLERVLVFEDDAVLAPDFGPQFARVMTEAGALHGPYAIYLGRGNNQHVGTRGPNRLIAGGLLPATDALVFNRAAAERRLAVLANHRITRPADWLTRETDAAAGVPHYWLAQPIVEQGSMNGRFASVLDTKRRWRGRAYARLRYRWDAWWKRLRRDLRARVEKPR